MARWLREGQNGSFSQPSSHLAVLNFLCCSKNMHLSENHCIDKFVHSRVMASSLLMGLVTRPEELSIVIKYPTQGPKTIHTWNMVIHYTDAADATHHSSLDYCASQNLQSISANRFLASANYSTKPKPHH